MTEVTLRLTDDTAVAVETAVDRCRRVRRLVQMFGYKVRVFPWWCKHFFCCAP